MSTTPGGFGPSTASLMVRTTSRAFGILTESGRHKLAKVTEMRPDLKFADMLSLGSSGYDGRDVSGDDDGDGDLPRTDL